VISGIEDVEDLTPLHNGHHRLLPNQRLKVRGSGRRQAIFAKERVQVKPRSQRNARAQPRGRLSVKGAVQHQRRALSRQARSAAAKRSATSRSRSAKKAARTRKK
jgi:hypothetical protein